MRKILFLFFIFSITGFSQSIDLGDLGKLKNTVADKKKKELYVFYSDDSLSIIDLVSFKEKSKSKISYPKQNFDIEFPILSIDSQIYFLNPFGGLVFRLENDKILRIDNSFDHRMQNNSTIFSHNDTIYKYGGYGFWSDRNFFTYYNNITNDWKIRPPNGSNVLPRGSQSSIVTIDEDNFYVYGGLSTGKFNPLTYLENKEVWKFDTHKKSWSNLGLLDSDLPEFKYFISYKNNQVYINESNSLYDIDVVKNKLKTYKKTPVQEKIVPSLKSFYLEGFFYCFVLDNNYESKIQLITISESDFFNEFIKEGSVYHNNKNLYYIIGVLFLIVILIFVYRFTKIRHPNRNKIIIDKEKLIFKKRTIPLDETRVSILKLLLKSNEEVTLNDIIKIYDKSDLDYGHNTRLINDVIEEINFKLSSTLDITENLITSEKSKLDKRIKVYVINKSYFSIR